MIEVNSPYEGLKTQAAARPHATFLAAPDSAELPYAPDGFAYRYDEAITHVETLRARYAAAGYGCGACVALLLESRPEYVWHWLALNALGVSIMPINRDLRADDLGYQLSIAEPDLVVALPETHSLIAKAWGPGRAHRRAGRYAACVPRERHAPDRRARRSLRSGCSPPARPRSRSAACSRTITSCASRAGT